MYRGGDDTERREYRPGHDVLMKFLRAKIFITEEVAELP